jgi:hypothetical protein
VTAELKEVKLVSKNIIQWTNVLVKVMLASVARDNIAKMIKVIKDSHVSS